MQAAVAGAGRADNPGSRLLGTGRFKTETTTHLQPGASIQPRRSGTGFTGRLRTVDAVLDNQGFDTVFVERSRSCETGETSARMPALIGSESVGHAATSAAKSAS